MTYINIHLEAETTITTTFETTTAMTTEGNALNIVRHKSQS